MMILVCLQILYPLSVSIPGGFLSPVLSFSLIIIAPITFAVVLFVFMGEGGGGVDVFTKHT